MISMTNILQQVKVTVANALERKEHIPNAYYNLIINNNTDRSNKTISFETINSAMRFVYDKDLMYNPHLDVQIIKVNHDGKNHVLRITNTKNVLEKT